MKKVLLSLLLAVSMLIPFAMPAYAATTVQMSKESATISIGEKVQLSTKVNGKVTKATWSSSNTSVATVSSTGLIKGISAGSSVITAKVGGKKVECLVSVLKKSTSSTKRYNVLVLDISGSMKGSPDAAQKAAAKRFCSKVLSTSGDNYVAIVSLNSSSKIVCGFTSNYNTLANYINKLSCTGNTNLNQALSKAGALLSGVSASGAMKNIVLCSDGLPTTGTKKTSGRYKSSDHKYYAYANAAYNTDAGLKKKGYFIYALGFFHSSSGKDLTFGKRLMKDLASKDKYYIIKKTTDLDDVFNDIADKITKVTMNKTSATIYVGDTLQLSAMENGVTKTASWKSSSTAVATVSAGKVKGVKAGTATITATINGKSATCKVTVKEKVTLKLNKSSMTLYVKEKGQLKATKTGTTAAVTFKSANKSIATVTSKGVVTGVKVGTTTITATVAGKSVTCKVTVKKASHPLYSMYFKSNPTTWKNKKTGKTFTVDEVGLRLVLNDGAVITKCGAYAVKSGDYWRVCMAFKGSDITSAKMSAYLSYKGKIVDDAMTAPTTLNKFTLSKNSSGIWVWSNYSTIRFNCFDTNGKNIANNNVGKQSENTKIFTSLSDMKTWLAK